MFVIDPNPVTGFLQGILKWGGRSVQKGLESGGPSPGKKKSEFQILVLIMAYFN